MTMLSIEPNGALVTGAGQELSKGGEARWALLLHTNSADIRIAMPSNEPGQHALLVMPKRAENLFSLLSDSVEEELELTFVLRGMPVDRAELSRLARELGLEPVLLSRPGDLSGGQKARLALAVLLLRGPSTLVLDNALEAIDEPSRSTVGALLRSSVDAGMRLVEMTTTAPLCARHVDEAYLDVASNWTRLDPAEGQERMRGWGNSDVPYGYQRQSMKDVVLRAKDLEFQYAGGFKLQVPEVCVRAGEILWIVGPNGAGKTTLLKCLALLQRPRKGCLNFFRGNSSLVVDLAEKGRKTESVHRFVLYQFQDPDDQIYCESVHEELIATARQCHGIDNNLVRKYSEQLGFSDKLGDSPWELGRSARRLLTLGSVLCAAPAVAMLDEPTVELDADQKLAIASALIEFAESGGACVVVSHDSRFMEAVCTTRLDMSEGKVGE